MAIVGQFPMGKPVKSRHLDPSILKPQLRETSLFQRAHMLVVRDPKRPTGSQLLYKLKDILVANLKTSCTRVRHFS